MAAKHTSKASAMKKGGGDQARLKKEIVDLSSTADFESLLKSGGGNGRYVLKLYVTGTTSRATQAITSIRSLCDEYLAGHYDLEVIDIYQQPDAAALEQIIAAPTLIKSEPAPARRVVGNLSDKDKILVSLNIRPEGNDPAVEAKTQWVKL